MSVDAEHAHLDAIPIDRIDRNPDNPRKVFRPAELEDLLESIRVYGVQVPISVYKEGRRYVLIDGERRWRCSLKLNRKTIPALVQEKPSPLTNLLLMFNIHALREQWDLLTIALKLPKIISLLEAESGRTPTEREIEEKAGLPRAVIRRCKLLMALPEHYKDQILDELAKPKSQQKFTEDLFIELERALTTVQRAMPELVPDRDRVRQVLLKKFRSEVITNRVDFRKVAKIARAEKVGADTKEAAKQLKKLFADNDYSIEAAFLNSVGEAYKERDIGTRIETLLRLLEDVEFDELEDDVQVRLKRLRKRLAELVGGVLR
jgi:ParB/RepB/Spo0J family partition protein